MKPRPNGFSPASTTDRFTRTCAYGAAGRLSTTEKKKQYDVLPRRTAEYSVLSRLAHIRTAHRSLSAKPDDGNLLLVFTVQLIVRTVWCNSCGKAYVNTVCCTRRYLCVRAAKKKRIVNKQTRQILITTLTIFVSERTRAV